MCFWFFHHLWSNIIFYIYFSAINCLKCLSMCRYEGRWEFITRKPSKFCREVFLKDFWSAIPCFHKSKIPEPDSLNTSAHDDNFRNDVFFFCIEPYFFFEFSNRAFTKKLTVFYFSTRKSPISRPGIDRKWPFNKKNMTSMFTDDMRCRRQKGARHKKIEVVVIYFSIFISVVSDFRIFSVLRRGL